MLHVHAYMLSRVPIWIEMLCPLCSQMTSFTRVPFNAVWKVPLTTKSNMGNVYCIVHVHGINCTLGKFSQLLQMYMHVSLGTVEIPLICGHETLLMCWALISCALISCNLPTLYAYILVSHLYMCTIWLDACLVGWLHTLPGQIISLYPQPQPLAQLSSDWGPP